MMDSACKTESETIGKYIIPQTATVVDALRRLNELSGDVMTLITTDSDGHMTGTVTDGDIRRGLLAGVNLTDNVEKVRHAQFHALRPGYSVTDVKQARQKGIKLLPILDSENRVKRLLNLKLVETLLPLRAILMAGGKGERLRPMTLSTPKPLLQIDGRPIIDYNIENLARAGITDVSITVRYLAEKIIEYFSTPHWGIQARCVIEDQPLGTIGSAALIERTEEGDTLVMNSDLLTTISLEDMYLHHTSEQADITIAAIPYTVSVPYAILAGDGCRVTALEEKPTYSHFANAGIYIFSNRILNSLVKGERTDATDLIDRAIASGKKVVSFPINGTWIDIGSPADFRHAEELMRHHRTMTL